MSKATPPNKKSKDELKPEYQFDYSKARPNRFADDPGSNNVVAVVLDSDVATIFRSSEDVNTMLRSVMSGLPKGSRAVPHKAKRKTTGRSSAALPRRQRERAAKA